MSVCNEIQPIYTVISYNESCYKIIKFRRSLFGNDILYPEQILDFDKSENGRFSQSISRSRRMIFEYALCNPWDFFFTGTFDGARWDRTDWSDLNTRWRYWIKDFNKKYDSHVKYLVVPERHEDGCWHMHGLLAGVPDQCISSFKRGVHPWKLVKNKYLNWDDYQKKFGFCSLGSIKNSVGVSYYITKYITADMDEQRDVFGKHLYAVSRGLRKAVKAFDLYRYSSYLDQFLEKEFDFVSTGMVTGGDWLFGSDLIDAEWNLSQLPDLYPGTSPAPELPSPLRVSDEDMQYIDDYAACEQIVCKGW